ncbi:MAG: hypothetical protein ACKOOD_03410 [Microbacteriaceae bacterium]
MNNAEFERPTPRALSDAELNAALDEAKQSPDGLLAAMILLEQQEQIRREDAEALRAWEDSKFNNLLMSSNESESVEESEHEVRFSPEPEESSQFESGQVELEMSVEESEEDFPIEPISASEVTVTTTLNQIVAEVNEAFDHNAAAEDATALEEVEQNIAPISSLAAPPQAAVTGSMVDAVVQPRKSPKAKPAGSALTFDFKSLAVPVVLSSLFIANGYSFGNVLFGSLIGIAMSALLSFGFALSKSRGSSSHQVLSRATFGVWGAFLPTKVLFLIRLFSIALLVWVATQEVFAEYSLPAQLTTLGAIEWSSQAGFALLMALVLWLLKLIPPATKWAIAVLSGLGIVLTAFSLASVNGTPLVSFDAVSLTSVALIYVVGDAFLAGPSNNEVLSNVNPWRLAKAVAFKQLLPAALAVAIASVAFGATSGLLVFGFGSAALALGLILMVQIQFDLSALRLTNPWIKLLSIALTAGAVVLVTQLNIPELISNWLATILAVVFAAQLPYLVEAFLRTDTFHELSLQRGYAFYRRFAIAALFGFISLAAASIVASPSIAALTTPEVLGVATLPLFVSALSIGFTLSTSWVRIRYQQGEVRNIEVRRNQLAGFDSYE